MAGLLDPGSPTYTTVPLDAQTNGLINNQIDLASQDHSQFAQRQNQGVAQAGAQAQQAEPQAQQEDMRQGYSAGAVNGAIRNQYNAQAGANIQRIQDANNQTSVFQKSAQLQQAAAVAAARQNVQTGSYERLMKAYNDTETARAQVLNSILGAGGMMAGYGIASAKHRRPQMQMTNQGQTTAEAFNPSQMGADNFEGSQV